jgi:hypothetical protein
MVLEATVLELLMRVTYEIHHSNGWHDVFTKFHKDWYGHSNNIKVIACSV